MIHLIVLGHAPFGNCVHWLDLLYTYVCEPFVNQSTLTELNYYNKYVLTTMYNWLCLPLHKSSKDLSSVF